MTAKDATSTRLERLDLLVQEIKQNAQINQNRRLSIRKRQKAAGTIVEMIDNYLENYRENIEPESVKELRAVRKHFEYSIIPISDAHKSINACSQRTKQVSPGNTRWVLADDLSVRCGEKFQNKINHYPLSATKLFTYLTGAYCSRMDPIHAKGTDAQRTVTVPLAPFIEDCGLIPEDGSLTPEQLKQKRKDVMRTIRQDFGLLFSTTVEVTDLDKENLKHRSSRKTHFISLFGEEGTLNERQSAIKGNTVTFMLGRVAAEYFTRSYHFKILHNCLFRIGGERSSVVSKTAFAMGLLMCSNWYDYRNRLNPFKPADTQRPTFDRLTVKYLFEHTPLFTPEVGKDPAKTIIRPFFKSLDVLINEVPFLSHYQLYLNDQPIDPNVDPQRKDTKLTGIKDTMEITVNELLACKLEYQIRDPKNVDNDVKRFYSKKQRKRN